MVTKKKYLACWTLMAVCLSICSCKNTRIPHNHIIGPDWKEVTLTPEPVSSFDDQIGLLAIYDVGDYILGYQYKQDYFFKIFDREYNLVGELCRRGKGPNEFLQVVYFGQWEADEAGTKIWTMDMIKKNLVKIDIEGSLKSGNLSTVETIDLSRAKNLDPRNIFYLDDSRLIGTDDKMACQTFTLNAKDLKPKFHKHYPAFPEKSYTHDISQNMAALKPDGSRMASVFFSLPQIDLIDANNGLTYFSLFLDQIVDPEKMEFDEDEEVFYCVSATDKYVYALSSKKGIKGGQAIYVMDWEGAPRCKIYVEPTTYFSVHEDKMIYCFDFDSDADVVKKYKIEGIGAI